MINDLEDINAYACLVYANDVDETNNCFEFDFNAFHYDLNAVSLSLNDSSVNEGDSVVATLTYKNSGDLNITNSFTVTFYSKISTSSTYAAITGCSTTVDTNLIIDENTATTCTFTAPTVAANATYNIKGVVNYADDYNLDNNSAITNLTVANVSSDSSSSSSSDSSDDDSEIDLDVIGFTYPSESLVDEEVTFTLRYKNIGDDDLTASYSVNIEISHKGDLEKKCSKTITTDLDSDESTSYICKWTPTKTGYYSLYAEVDYSNDDDEDNDYIDNKVIRIIDKKAVVTTKTISDNTENALFSDLTESLSNLNLIAYDYNNYLFSDVEVVRDFNVVLNDDNTYTTHVKLTLTTDKNSVLENYFYYEYLPDENKFLEFELDLNGNATLEYDLNYEVPKDLQARFYGALFSKDLVNEPKPIYNSDKGAVLYYIAMVVLGLIIIALIVWLVLKIITSRKNQFNPYKKHKKVVRVEEKHQWQGFGVDDAPKVKYKGGKFKHKEPVKTATYKGWK